MKVIRKHKPDAKKASAVAAVLSKVSERHLAQTVSAVPAAPVTKIKLNIKGNRRGMNSVENPPDSEEMRKRRAMRRLWNKQMPVLNCSNCQFSAQCPQFKAGYQCAFQPFLDSHKVENEEDLIFYAKELLGENIKRAQLTILMERLSGAKPDLDTSEALMHLFTQLMQLHERLTEPDASVEVESSDGTIIGRLFGGLDRLIGTTREHHTRPIDTPLVPAEVSLDERVKVEHAKAQQDLVGELALIKSNSFALLPTASVRATDKPLEEEL